MEGFVVFLWWFQFCWQMQQAQYKRRYVHIDNYVTKRRPPSVSRSAFPNVLFSIDVSVQALESPLRHSSAVMNVWMSATVVILH